jgi:hypothetical protein
MSFFSHGSAVASWRPEVISDALGGKLCFLRNVFY